MIRNDIIESIRKALQNLGISAGVISLEHPSGLNNGDYSTNVAMAYAKQSGTNPRALAEQIKTELEKELPKEIEKVEVAGAGFINFYLSRQFFADSISEIVKQNQNWGKNTILTGKKVMVEYTQPNPFKPFHIGHLMSNAIGESISRVVEFSGAKTIRANYQGDVGLHVAKAIYGLQKFGMPDTSKSVSEQAQYIGEQYAKGSDEYENNPEAKTEIDAINKKVYDRSDEK